MRLFTAGLDIVGVSRGPKTLKAALAGAVIVLFASPSLAQTTAGAPSQEEIGRQLKTRGLPTLGLAPTGPIPGLAPAGLPSAPAAGPAGRRPIHSAASHAPSVVSPSVTLRTITFEFGSAQLRPESIETLRNLGNALNQELKDEKLFVIEGHTDRTGARGYNDELSKRRADAVKDYLVNRSGVSTDRLRTVGKGFSEPADPQHPYAAGNRRVVVVNAGTS